MDCLPIPQSCLNFLLRSKTYLKEHPPSANRDFPLSSKSKHVVRLVYAHYKVQIMLLLCDLHSYRMLRPMMSHTICAALSASSTQY